MVNIERLRAHPDNKTKQAMQHDCELAADEIESLCKDAERYRWLEARHDAAGTVVIQAQDENGMPLRLGDAIDAQMTAG